MVVVRRGVSRAVSRGTASVPRLHSSLPGRHPRCGQATAHRAHPSCAATIRWRSKKTKKKNIKKKIRTQKKNQIRIRNRTRRKKKWKKKQNIKRKQTSTTTPLPAPPPPPPPRSPPPPFAHPLPPLTPPRRFRPPSNLNTLIHRTTTAPSAVGPHLRPPNHTRHSALPTPTQFPAQPSGPGRKRRTGKTQARLTHEPPPTPPAGGSITKTTQLLTALPLQPTEVPESPIHVKSPAPNDSRAITPKSLRINIRTTYRNLGGPTKRPSSPFESTITNKKSSRNVWDTRAPENGRLVPC